MKTISFLILALALVWIQGAQAKPIEVLHVKEDIAKISITSPLWEKVKATTVEVYPQTTIEMNDAQLILENAQNKAKKISVKSINNGTYVAFLVRWKDATKSIQQDNSSTTYGDGFAIQFPTKMDKLPYIGMGSDQRAVIVHLEKATSKTYEPNNKGDVYHQVDAGNQNAFGSELKKYNDEVLRQSRADYQRVFISEGFRSMTQIRESKETSVMDMHYANGIWSGILVRPLKSEYVNLGSGSFPVAFALWDGSKKNRDGAKLLSPWVGVGAGAIASLAEPKGGDVANGEKVMMENCSACHQYKSVKNAPAYMAPELSNIGGYGNASYIRESIIAPSAVVVPGYNTAAHPNFQWYSVDKGVRTSTMPPYDYLDEKSLNDLIAYMQTLKAEVEK